MSDSGILRFDAERARAVEAIYLTPDVVAQREEVLRALDPRTGERVLDLGVGPGLLASAIAERVGAGGAVHGIDVSPDMLAIAAGRRPAPGAAVPELREASVTDLPFPDGAFDAAVCTQVYEYVADMPLALREAARVLRAGGRLVVLDTDWDSIVWRSSDDARMARVLAAWDAHLVHRGLPRQLPELLRGAGLHVAAVAVVPLLNVGYDPQTYSAGMRDLIADFVTGQGIPSADAAAWREDLMGLGDRSFFSLNRYLFTAVRA
ncbi:MAG TPA: methyltransferase domain-containing protein [Miltoncostaeaceae bacterium]|jgi:SAM-dependent methyltransferase|nr:methyltransferase domain-containing protein [Miltoncostaeaceae bacterium]